MREWWEQEGEKEGRKEEKEEAVVGLRESRKLSQ